MTGGKDKRRLATLLTELASSRAKRQREVQTRRGGRIQRRSNQLRPSAQQTRRRLHLKRSSLPRSSRCIWRRSGRHVWSGLSEVVVDGGDSGVHQRHLPSPPPHRAEETGRGATSPSAGLASLASHRRSQSFFRLAHERASWMTGGRYLSRATPSPWVGGAGGRPRDELSGPPPPRTTRMRARSATAGSPSRHAPLVAKPLGKVLGLSRLLAGWDLLSADSGKGMRCGQPPKSACVHLEESTVTRAVRRAHHPDRTPACSKT